ncbi:LacI family transcriptional regulator [Glutamicibacter sp. JL.03c]|uniref:LacI family DNA-binding transcriptional regulator n=1 Tax=Glutamicibacter sp. JL.03c TaxID=2984842 RepID=UPI0021F7F404|nr:LacI family DNA-binding transcriptional regulator [Glutamicibacter sp. JL.03c]UYQ77657.1 LacI family transcriptional regulator [Glutamicibacter sp. JL.03c]
MAIRLTDVANEAGVSLATASRVLNGSARKPAAEISDKVRAAAEKLGYFPNAQAQALARASTKLIGLVVRDIADPYFSTIARGVQRGLGDSGTQLLLASTDSEPEREIEAVRAFMSQRTDAIILSGSRGQSEDDGLLKLIENYQENGGQVVVIGQPLASTGGIQVDNETTSENLAGDLIRAGHRKFIVLAGDENLLTSRHRAQGFLSKLKRTGLAAVEVVHGAFSREGAYMAMSDYLQARKPEGAGQQVCVFCVSDVMALGAIRAIRESGLRVPEDIAVVGFDDIPTLEDVTPSVSTARLPLEEIGRWAGEMVLSHGDARKMVVTGTTVLRESSRLRDGNR